MKRELKDVMHYYLPYGVKCELIDQGKKTIGTLSGCYLDHSYCFFDTVESEHGCDSIKPILRPLSDLTKEIEHNGEKFVPMDELYKLDDEITVSFDTQIFISDECDLNLIPLSRLIEIQKKLLSWHFNIFDLPSDQWIDINTLEKDA